LHIPKILFVFLVVFTTEHKVDVA